METEKPVPVVPIQDTQKKRAENKGIARQNERSGNVRNCIPFEIARKLGKICGKKPMRNCGWGTKLPLKLNEEIAIDWSSNRAL